MSEERLIKERYDLTIERIRMIVDEETVAIPYCSYFQKTAKFLLTVHEILGRVSSKKIEECTLQELQEENPHLVQTKHIYIIYLSN